MLIPILLVLLTVKVNGEPVDQDGLRKSRQLVLGLQDLTAEKISTTVQLPSDTKDNVLNTHLPPASSSESASGQSQEAFDSKSVSSVENKLCKSPFDNCGPKDSSNLDFKISKPSRDLVPPFNDLEKELALKRTVHLVETKKQKPITIRFDTDYQNRVVTSTEKTATKTSEQNTARSVKILPKSNAVANKAEATNELRSYLLPQSEFSVAAQTNVAVLQPINQDREHDHHHHHHHHHGDDFNICADAFHSFLCAPLKARKRITGALPDSLKSQSSFINYQKSLLNFDRETAPSNTFKNEYLPPKPSPTNFISSSYSSPKPSPTNLIPSSYSSPKPSPTNLIPSSYSPPKPSPTNLIPSSYSSPKPSPTNLIPSSYSSPKSSPTNLIPSSYLPPKPSPTNLIPSSYSPPKPSPTNLIPSSYSPPKPSPTNLIPSSYLPPKPSPTNLIPSSYSSPKPSPTNLIPSSYSSPKPSPTNLIPSSYLPPKPSPTNLIPSSYSPPKPSPTNLIPSSYLPPKPSPTNLIPSSYSPPKPSPTNLIPSSYSPPKPFPTNLIPSSYLPPLTTKRPTSTITTTLRSYSSPKITSEPLSMIDRFRFAQVANNKVQNFSLVKSAPSNQEYTTVSPSSTSIPLTFSKTTLNTASSSPSQEISLLQNFFNASSSNAAVFNPVASNENRFYLPPNPNSLPSASVISTTQNILPITSTFSSQTATFVPFPTISTFVPLSSNSIVVPQKPKIQPTVPVVTTTVKTTVFTTTPKSDIHLSSFDAQPSKASNSYIPPATKSQSFSTTTTKPHTSTLKYSEQSSNTDRSYLPPDLKEPAAAQISSNAVAAPQTKNPFHHGRDLCTDPFHSFLCTNAKPRKRITGQVPEGFKPESSKTDELRLKPEPSTQDESKVHPNKLLENTPVQNLEYKYPKQINSLPTSFIPVSSSTEPSSSSSYAYSKPNKIFPLPSQETFKLTSAASFVMLKKPEPTLKPSEAKVVSGYQYPKPNKDFPLPTERESATVATTTRLPSTGYSYPRPPKPFPLPTEQKEIIQKIKPQATTSFPSSTSLPTNQAKGYLYPKPEQNLKLPEKKGYSYPKPEKRLELPNENRSKFLLPQSSSNLDALKNLGSADFIPVNKIEFKRAEPSKLLVGMRRFGERMKKRERQTLLLKRQLH